MKKNVLESFGKLVEEGGVSRRGVMKSFLAMGAAGALYGCGKSDDATQYIYPEGSLEADPEPPQILEEIYGGVVPHNCGGSCLMKAHVRGGVIKRVTTDETPEKHFAAPVSSLEYGDFLQNRSCPRCRSQKMWIYGTNRLMYPMIQTKERGDLSGFKRVSWDEAAAYFKAKVDKIRKTWGPSFYRTNATGAGGMLDMPHRTTFYGLNINAGGIFAHRDNYSWPAFSFLSSVVDTRSGTPTGDNWIHMLKCDEIVLWSANYSENGLTDQGGWYLKQFREIGKKITVVEPRFQQTTISIADKYLPLIGGTDGALAQALMYCMLAEYRDDLFKTWNITSGTDEEKNAALRRTIGKYVYGFFDAAPEDDGFVHPDGTPGPNVSYRPDAEVSSAVFNSKFRVPAGTSFSAYIRGNVKDPCNQAASAYPETVGYNAAAPGQFPNMFGAAEAAKGDPLHGKRVPCYGQVPKTPEWASKITGIKPADIRELAKSLVTKRVNVTFGGGIQRNSESETQCWSALVMCYIFRGFGEAGRNHGIASQRADLANPIGNPSHPSTIKPGDFQADIPNSCKYDGTKSHKDFINAQGEYTNGYLNSAKSAIDTGCTNRLGNNFALTFNGSDNGSQTYGAVSRAVAIQNWCDYVEASHSTNFIDDPVEWRGRVRPSRWANGQVQGAYAPVKSMTITYCAAMLNQTPDTNHTVRLYTSKRDSLKDTAAVPGVTGVQMNPYGYDIEFIWGHDVVMTPQCRWSDLILPGASSMEKFSIGSTSRQSANKIHFTGRAVLPPGECIPEIAIDASFAKAYGMEDKYWGGIKGAGKNIVEQASDFEFKLWFNQFMSKSTDGKILGMSMQEWAQRGIVKTYEDALYQPMPPITDEDWYKNPSAAANLKKTPSGRIDAFSTVVMEAYESRNFPNIDKSVTLPAELYTKRTQEMYDAEVTANGSSNYLKYGRIVYPIPVYVPPVEGIYADGSHPDPLDIGKDGFVNQVVCWHPMIRSHATFSSVPFTCELKYWKRNSKGQPTHPSRNITNADAGADHWNLKDTDTMAPSVWQDDVYETVWINPKTKYYDGSDIKEGELVVLESLRGKIIASAHISQRTRPNVLGIAQGSWYDPIDHPVHGNIDRGGNVNTLSTKRGSRINQCTTMATDCRVKIYPYVPMA